MAKRGRKSADELSVTVNMPSRPAAPADLTEAQQKIWHEMVGQYPVDWFPKETHPLLAAFCRHVTTSKNVAEKIESLDHMQAPIDDMDKLYRMQERESAALARVATKLRMTPQAKYDPITAARKVRNAATATPEGGKPVWENY
jgi:hypothetical protein